MFTIEEVREKCRTNEVRFSFHALGRMRERNVDKEDIVCCLLNGEFIEEYEDDSRGESALVYGKDRNDQVLHVLVTLLDGVFVITLYYPDTDKFEDDLKTRRKRK